MDAITKEDRYFHYQIGRIVEEQKKTNELLQQLLDTMKPPTKEVEIVERNANARNDKRKRG